MVGSDGAQGCIKSPHLVPEGCHRQQEPFLVKGKPRCARLSFHKRKGFYFNLINIPKKHRPPPGWPLISGVINYFFIKYKLDK